MDFNIKNYAVLHVGGVDVWITETIVNTWIIMTVLIVFAIAVRIGMSKFQEIPTGLQNAVEAVIEAFNNFVKNSAGEKMMYLGNWYFMVFVFVLTSNLSGLVGMRPPTADWSVTFAFAFSTLIWIQVAGIRHRKGEYLKSFFSPNPVFFPLNLIGELARPVSLSFRLFGNILAGMIMMSLIYSLAPVFIRILVPVPLHVYFDVFTGAIQTYVFCILSLTFIGNAAEADG